MIQKKPENIHPECARMHRHGYCICVTVQCISCDRNHPPHKPGQCPPVRDLVKLEEK